MRFGSSGKSFGAAAFRHYERTAGFLAFIASGMSFPYNLASAQIYSITDLGTLGGGTSEAWGINTQGDVVGRAQIADGRMRAFVFPAGGSMINLGTLAGSVGNWSIAFHINDLGQISGDSSTGTSFEPYHAILYTGGVMSNLGTLGGRNSQGFSINKGWDSRWRCRYHQHSCHAWLFLFRRSDD